jgi:hypothetical protein
MYLAQLTTLLFLIIIPQGCGLKNEKVDEIVTSPKLLLCLTDIINHVDSFTVAYETYGIIKSFNVTFTEENNKCFVTIMGDFDYYDSHAMQGYFMFKNKTVTIYGVTSFCGRNLININKLKKGKINWLNDFDNEQFNNAIKLNITPPAPPPPREPYYRKYLIADKDNFQLVEDYDQKQ